MRPLLTLFPWLLLLLLTPLVLLWVFEPLPVTPPEPEQNETGMEEVRPGPAARASSLAHGKPTPAAGR
jgi:hypothetical protein